MTTNLTRKPGCRRTYFRLTAQTAQLCQDVLDSIGTSETGVHQKTLNRLVKFIDQFKSMNFVNDSVMEQQLEEAKKEQLSRTAEEYRDSATARNRLVQGLGQLRDKARSRYPRSGTAMGILLLGGLVGW